MENSTEWAFLMPNDTNGTDSNFNGTNYTPYARRVETYLVPIVFAIIFIIGVLGNGTLIIVFIRHRAMRNVPNTYILSLALADLLVILTCVPFTSVVYTVDSWPWGETMCKLSETMKDVSIGVSVFTLTALSADRFFAIVDPLRKLHATGGSRRATRLTLMTATSIWIISFLGALPAMLGSYLKVFRAPDGTPLFTVCYPFPDEWGGYEYAKANVLARFLTFYAIPLTVISGFYAVMARHLFISAKNVPGEMQSAHRQIRVRKKVAITVLTFVVVFAICFLPSHLFMLWFYLNYPDSQEHYNAFWHVCRILGFCLTYMNSCVNPIALYCVSGTFRKHFNRYLLCKDPQSSRSRCNTCKGQRTVSMSLTASRRSTVYGVNRHHRPAITTGHDTSVTIIGNGNGNGNGVDHACSKM